MSPDSVRASPLAIRILPLTPVVASPEERVMPPVEDPWPVFMSMPPLVLTLLPPEDKVMLPPVPLSLLPPKISTDPALL